MEMVEGMQFIVNIFMMSFTFDYYHHFGIQEIIGIMSNCVYGLESIIIGN